MIICIAGKSGSGKSTLAEYLASIRPNTVYLNIDIVGHKVNELDEVMNELRYHFGDFIFADGKVNRKRLGTIVFNSSAAMHILECITWKHMKRIIDEFIQANRGKDIILDWFKIVDTEYFKECDLSILVDAPYEVRLARTINRDGINEEKFRARESKSIDYSNHNFDIVVENIDYEIAKEKVRKIA